jgi:uncharacterized membrane protein YkoI
MRDGAAAARTVCRALALVLLLPLAIIPAAAQEQSSAQALIERLQQIQGRLEGGAAQAAQRQPARADDLIQQVQVIRQQSLAAAATEQRPALDADEVQRLVREGLGVDVLRVELVEHDGQPVYALTVMNPPGDDNAAFMVRTLLVDGATGGLLGEVPHTPRAAAPDLTSDTRTSGFDGSGLEIRRRTYR